MANYNMNVSDRELKKLTLENFKGFDFSSSIINVDKHHATAGRNFINEDGVNRKRNGWNEIIRFAGGGKINGMWQFEDEDGERHTIVHCGKHIYEITNIEKQINSFSQDIICLTESMDISRINGATRSYAAIQNNRLYILCGDYLVYVKRDEVWKLERVYDNIDTYVPTTTISIDCLEGGDLTPEMFDEINMLSSYRINTMTVPHNLTHETQGVKYDKGLTYYLDTTNIDRAEVIITIQTFHPATDTDKAEVVTTEYRNKKSEQGEWQTQLYKYPFETTGAAIGSVEFGDDKNNAQIFFSTKDVFLPMFEKDSSDRISVKFQRVSADYEARVTKCTIGTLFGTHGNTDRMFISGNPKYKNMDFHSEMDDFTYFGDLSVSAVGSNTTAIMGYSRLGDGTLAVHKEDSSQESTIYYRSGTFEPVYKDIKDSDGNVAGQKVSGNKAIFPLKSGSIGEGVISSYANANLSGDNLMLSANGVYGIVLGQNVATNERFARERSRTINQKLCKEKNLQDAVSIVYKNKYYLAVNNNCYIADVRHTNKSKNDMPDTFNYEWWFWDNISARVFAIFDNRLYFGTPDGRICRFDEDNYSDKSYIEIGAGGVSIDYEDSSLIIDQDYADLFDRLSYRKQGQRDYIVLKGQKNVNGSIVEDDIYVYRIKAEDIFKTENNRIYLNDTAAINGVNMITTLTENEVVFADNVGASGLAVDTLYRISAIDYNTKSFAITLNGNVVEMSDTSDVLLNLCMKINDEELEIITEQITGGYKYYLRLKGFSANAEFARYDNRLVSIENACFYLNDNVVAEWYTAVFDLGTPEYSKNIKQLAIVAESNVSSEIHIGYETRKIEKMYTVSGTSLFDFNEIDFNDFTFEVSDFTKSYVRKIKEKNVNFIVFRVYSDNDRGAAVNKIIVTYVIGKKLKGVN